MMLNKDIQELLEGVHYFLSETLSGESLSGKVECLRRGLVLQLESLSLNYPTLKVPITSLSSKDRPLSGSISNSSGSSASYSYSNNSSADGIILAKESLNSSVTTDDEYDKCDDNKNFASREKNIFISSKRCSLDEPDDLEDSDDIYSHAVDPVPFSSLIAKCNKHGSLFKKSKGLIRNTRQFRCVVANGLLYLYNKESDERQRKAIDLSGYSTRDVQSDEIKDKCKRACAFELVGPGKKTHVVYEEIDEELIKRLIGSSVPCSESQQSSDIQELYDFPEGDSLSHEMGNLVQLIWDKSETSPASMAKKPPNRPPPPSLSSANKNSGTVLIEDESSGYEDEMYCEIDEGLVEESSNNSLLSSQNINTPSRGTLSNSPPPLPERGFIPSRVILEEEYDVPQEPENVQLFSASWITDIHKPDSPPKLPAKGENTSCTEDNVYSVPPCARHIQEDYQIPPVNPKLADEIDGAECNKEQCSISQISENSEATPVVCDEESVSNKPVSSVKEMIIKLNANDSKVLEAVTGDKLSEKPKRQFSVDKTAIKPDIPLKPRVSPSILDECSDNGKNSGDFYLARFAYISSSPEYLSFSRGDEMHITDRNGPSGSWRGTLKGKSGFVLKEYLKVRN